MRNIITLAILFLSSYINAQTSVKYEEAILNRDPMGFRIHMARTIKFPEELRQQKIKGDALLMFKVDTTGFIDSITTLYASHDAIAEQATEALQQTDGRWTAAKLNGRYIPSWVYAPVKLDASKNGNGITNVAAIAQGFHKDGEAKLKKGNSREAVQLFNAAYYMDPSNASPLYDVARTYFKTRENDLACFYLQKINSLIRGVSPELKQQVTNDLSKNCSQ